SIELLVVLHSPDDASQPLGAKVCEGDSQHVVSDCCPVDGVRMRGSKQVCDVHLGYERELVSEEPQPERQFCILRAPAYETLVEAVDGGEDVPADGQATAGKEWHGMRTTRLPGQPLDSQAGVGPAQPESLAGRGAHHGDDWSHRRSSFRF